MVPVILMLAGLVCGVGALKTAGRTRIILASCTFILAGIVSFLILTGRSSGGAIVDIDRSFETVAGRRLGDAIATDIREGKIGKGDGTVVVGVLNLPYSTEHTRNHGKAYLEGLMEGLKGVPAEVRSCSEEFNEQAQAITFGEGGGVDMMTVIGLAVESIPGLDAFVTFIGLPANAKPDRFKGLPPIYAFNGQPNAALATHLRSGEVRGAVTFRPDADWLLEPDPALTWQELFDQRYVFLGSDN